MAADFTMVGGKPWGIRMQGGKDTDIPLQIAQVTPGSKAATQGIVAGMEILSINDTDTAFMSMIEAQCIIKGATDVLKLGLKQDVPQSQSIAAAPAGNDDPFYEDLKNSFGGGDDRGRSEVKGGTFRMMKEHVDAGKGGAILSAFDKPCTYGERNASIRTMAPTLQGDTGERTTKVTMEGGKPWGIRIQGGKGTTQPLHIANVQAGSKAYHKSLLLNDKIMAINGHDTSDLSMTDAQNLIKETGSTLALDIISVNQPGARVEKADDEKFFKELAESVKGGNEDWSKKRVKGGAFQQLQTAVDTGNIKR